MAHHLTFTDNRTAGSGAVAAPVRISTAKRLRQLEQGRLVQGHGVDPFYKSAWSLLTEPHVVAPSRRSPTYYQGLGLHHPAGLTRAGL